MRIRFRFLLWGLVSMIAGAGVGTAASHDTKKTETKIQDGSAAWPNPLLSNIKAVEPVMSKKPNSSSDSGSLGSWFASIASGSFLSGCGTNPNTSTTTTASTSYTCPSGEVAVGNNLCCPSSTPYLCGSPALCYASPCGTSTSSGGGSSTGTGCTAKVCCGGLYECNNRCYATCVPGSQPCCSATDCVCYTPCC